MYINTMESTYDWIICIDIQTNPLFLVNFAMSYQKLKMLFNVYQFYIKP